VGSISHWNSAAQSYWPVSPPARAHGAPSRSIYKTIHKSGSTSVSQGAHAGKEHSITIDCGLKPKDHSHAQLMWWTVVRDPIRRFVSGATTVLGFGQARQHQECVTAAGARRFHRAYVGAMLAYDETAARGFRYDMHTGSQANALACLQRAGHMATGDGVAGGTRPPRLTFISKQEQIALRGGLVHPSLLPLKLGKLGAGRGEGKACELHLENLTTPLLRKLCAYYAQDFVCFQYPVPPACRS